MFPRSKRARVVAAMGVAILLGIFVPPLVTANRLKGRIAGAISNALGRKASFGEIHLRLLPQPGFDITNFIVEDDPAFGPEPMLRADEVTAYLRLTSLWQGRLEVAQLSLKNPSLNLVRNERDEWNLAGPLEHASQAQNAPTAKRRPEARLRFPYIEASDGRINFKSGQEKKSFAFSEADFALWLASENEWRMRLEARPIRTDANLSDTGTVRLEGSAVRGATLNDTALHFDFEWEKAQLGNLTQLVWGRDRGWRGALDVDGSISGTPRELLLSARARVGEFHRYDIIVPDTLNLDARCTAHYLGDTQTLSNIDCHLPAGNGEIAARGMVAGIFVEGAGERRWELSVSATDVPMPELVRFARHTKKDIPADLAATGDVDAAFTYRTAAAIAAAAKPGLKTRAKASAQDVPASTHNVWTGGGASSTLRISANALSQPLEAGPVRFVLGPMPDLLSAPAAASPFHRKQAAAAADAPASARLTFEPFTIALGATTPVTVEGRLDRSAYAFTVRGDTDLRRLLAVATVLGLRPPQMDAAGSAHLDLALGGDWKGFAPPLVTGSVQLRGVSAEIKGVNAPVQLNSAQVVFSGNGVDAVGLSTSFTGSSVMFQGSVHVPRGCSTLLACAVRFELTSPVLNLDDLNRLLNPRFAAQPWYRFFVGSTPTTGLRRLQASGTIGTPRLVVKSVIANRFFAFVGMKDGRVTLKDVNAEVFGGKHSGTWTADFSGNTPVYTGEGSVEKADVAHLAAVMRDSWGAGVLTTAYKFSASGDTAADFAGSSIAELRFDWRNGMLRHVSLHGTQPLRIKSFTGTVDLRDARLTFPEGRMETPEGIYTVSGSSTFARAIDFKLAGTPRSYTVTGTLERPRVVTPPDTEAVLKQ
ncbi:MAG: AsmA family protein [Candidatus Koribacter versatilis]|uniref:AsmA family protein n=1 Tax=Candidatus Korobacter versatilis TaxID=658062 RepID=A0A932ERY9_9BACT|nr:AsmA family protein [Candidatus Koribacter versatilis]